MTEISLDDSSKQEIIDKLQDYFSNNLDRELGSFEAQFLLDFFAEEMGCVFYNQGLADAMQAMENKLAEISEVIYELEQQPRRDDN